SIITKEDVKNYDIDFHEAHCIGHNDSITAFTIYALSSGRILAFILNILQGYHFSVIAYAKRGELIDPLTTDIIEVR
ncbi:unnamed protein product, partial [Adineta steineri]